MISESMKRNPVSYKYVGGMLNICYLTGFVRNPQDGKGFLLQQNNNLAQAIQIRVAGGDRIPRDKTPVTVLCHLFGEKDANGEQQLLLKAIDIQKPSVRSMPALSTWVRGTGDSDRQDDFRPFGTGGKVKDEENIDGDTEQFTETEQILRDILNATRGRLDSRLGDNANVVLVAGFIDSMAYISGNSHQKDGYGAIQLRQHENTDLNIPVRLVNPRAVSIMRNVAMGVPISVIGQIRNKIIPNEDGTIKSSHLHVRVSDLFRADREKDIRTVPEWWSGMRDRLVEDMASRKKAKAEREAAKSIGDQQDVIDGI
jgi:hypothetical protein